MKTIWLMLVVCLMALPIRESDSRKVIFYARNSVQVAHLFGAGAAGEICRKCFDKDHRGRCRRVVSFIQSECWLVANFLTVI